MLTCSLNHAYDLETWPKIPLKKFTIKNCLFGATNMVKNSDKEKYVHSDYEIAFDGKSKWSFDNDTAGNVVIFGIDNSSWHHTDNLKNNFLMLDEGDTFGINGSFGGAGKKN